MSKYHKHTLRKTFIHKGFEIECIMTQALIHGYTDHGHFNIVFMDKKTGDVLHSEKSYNGPPKKIITLDKKIEDFKQWDYDLIDELYQGEEEEEKEEPRDLRNFWAFVNKAQWKSDHDYNRIKTLFENDEQRESLREDYQYLLDKLHEKFYDSWLGYDGNGGINASDDSWWDLRADVIGRGKKFYEEITVKKLQHMANNYDYEENFGYSFQKD